MDQYTYNRYTDKALRYFREERYEKALKYFNRLLDVDWNDSSLWSLKGFCHERLGDFQGALESYDRCININPLESAHWTGKGRNLGNIGSFQGAIICFDKALEIDPSNVGALNLKGLTLVSLGEFNEAINCYNTALALDPLNEVIEENRIYALNALENEENGLDGLTGNLICSRCGFENLKESKYCEGCGELLKFETENYICISCGFENINGANFCSGCGGTLDNSEQKNNIICGDCGSENIHNAVFCQQCGKNLKEPQIEILEEVEIVDINTDSEDKIASLPHIGAILARKAIQIRNSQGGFESVEDFCIRMELKPHIAKNIENLIICGSIRKPKKPETSGRIVDF